MRLRQPGRGDGGIESAAISRVKSTISGSGAPSKVMSSRASGGSGTA